MRVMEIVAHSVDAAETRVPVAFRLLGVSGTEVINCCFGCVNQRQAVANNARWQIISKLIQLC